MSYSSAVIYASMAGILPALIWLLFLLREDAKHPEPKRLIALTFLLGMVAVPLSLPLERFACSYLSACNTGHPAGLVLLAWAVIEETLKFGLIALAIMWRKEVDEPIDCVVYMITAALGFAALENALFLIAPFSSGSVAQGFLTDNLRFVGSTLLHVVASSAIGFSLGFSWRLPRAWRALIAAGGVILAIGLHLAFNILIISGGTSSTLAAFLAVWTGVLVLFALFEVLVAYGKRDLSASS